MPSKSILGSENYNKLVGLNAKISVSPATLAQITPNECGLALLDCRISINKSQNQTFIIMNHKTGCIKTILDKADYKSAPI